MPPDLGNDERECEPSLARITRFGSLLAPCQVAAPQFRFVPLLGCAIILLNDAEFFFKQTAMFRAIEAMYCIEYYTSIDPTISALGRSIPERLCKVDAIEKEVATTYGWILFCRMLPCVFTAIPLGYLADRAGRRPVLILHKVGTIIFVSMEIVVYLLYPILPIWVLYVSGFGALVGANFDLSLAMLFASYTDVMPSAKQRATLFFVTTAMQYIGQAFFPIISGRLINLDGKGGTAEVSLFVSLGTALLALGIITFLFPETLIKDKGKIEQEPLIMGSTDEDEIEIARVKAPRRLSHRLRTQMKTSWAQLNDVILGLGAIKLLLLIPSMFLANTAIKAIDMLGLVQYPVIKFGWAFSDVTFVTSLQAVVYSINYLFLLPGYTRIGAHFKFSSSATSLSVMMLSAVILILGSILLGSSTTVPTFIIAMAIYTLGTGFPVVIQAYISNLVEKDRVARVLATLSTFAVAGKLAVVSLGPAVFKVGIESDREELKGLLFFFCATFFAGSGAIIGLIALRSRSTKLKNAAHDYDDVVLREMSGRRQQRGGAQTPSCSD